MIFEIRDKNNNKIKIKVAETGMVYYHYDDEKEEKYEVKQAILLKTSD